MNRKLLSFVSRKLRPLATLTFLLIIASAFAVEPSAVARDEIEHLLTYLEQSGCEFFRNGEWYGAAKARDHLNEKYSYLQKKSLIGEAEDFIRLAAAKSSVSGKSYQVRCQASKPIPSEIWLSQELSRYRQERGVKK
jgi:hypothetical protein